MYYKYTYIFPTLYKYIVKYIYTGCILLSAALMTFSLAYVLFCQLDI